MRCEQVLLVEDDLALQDVLCEVLAEDGFEVRLAANGREALEHLADWQPAVILLDLMMPVMDGWEFLRQARQRKLLRSSRVVALTASRLPPGANSLGVDALVRKPFDIDFLLSLVGRLAQPRDGPS